MVSESSVEGLEDWEGGEVAFVHCPVVCDEGAGNGDLGYPYDEGPTPEESEEVVPFHFVAYGRVGVCVVECGEGYRSGGGRQV